MDLKTVIARFDGSTCNIQFNRPEAKNTINAQLVTECHTLLDECENEKKKVVVFEGSPDVFCYGADFQGIHAQRSQGSDVLGDASRLYDLWLRMATGPFISVCHVRGAVNAGGVGFVAASDIVIAQDNALFSLSELLFGLYPACVLPFLIRKIGFQRAHYMTLTAKAIPVQQALAWGLVDAHGENSETLIKQQLIRLQRPTEEGIARYKRYMQDLSGFLSANKDIAVRANKAMFSDPESLSKIYRFMETGRYPWED